LPVSPNMRKRVKSAFIVFYLFFVLILSFLFTSSVFAIFCPQCGTLNASNAVVCKYCVAKLPDLPDTVNTLSQAQSFFEQENYDKTITILESYCDKNRDYKADVLLAKAYLAKCDILKEEGGSQYMLLAVKALHIGQDLMKISDYQYFPDALYICARYFYFNNSNFKAERYIKKAIKLSSQPSADYFFALGDIYVAKGKRTSTIDIYNKIIAMDVSSENKGMAYYKLGTFLLKIGRKEGGKEALESALQFTNRESLNLKIHSTLKDL
jgi:tetratricopeptide (TPR) repeat protein